ncbi:hypothetical protein ACFWBC_36725 [Streptomyces sp. NPDC059985]|uniref:hypothetical protein n=1 Tax=Streptomyces sp. NPDC059985 TaxID=3347025 RepID=UPI0036807B7D
MPERSIPALRAAMAAHAPEILADFDANWRSKIAVTHGISAAPAFLTRWWGEYEYAVARDPDLNRHMRDLEERVAQSADPDKAKAFLEESAQIHIRVSLLGPGE